MDIVLEFDRLTAFSNDTGVTHLKLEIVGKDKNGNEKYTSVLTKQPTFAMRRTHSSEVPVRRYTKDYRELAQYLSESWLSVKKDWDRSNPDRIGGPVYYTEKECNSGSDSFVPFDWDEWLERRLYDKATPVVPHS